MRWLMCCVAFLLLFFIGVVLADNNLYIGPIYLSQASQLQILIEKPRATEGPVFAPKPDELVLIEDGKATVTASSVSSFGESGLGMAFVVAVDVSRSMEGQPLRDVKAALEAFADKISPKDFVALVSFADEWKEESSFGDSHDKLRASIKNLTAKGNQTKLNTALFKSLGLFNAPNLPLRKRLIVISDGRDEGSYYRQEDVIDEARSKRIPVDTIGITQRQVAALEYMERLAGMSNGIYVRASNSEELKNIFQQGIERLHSTPLATFNAQNLRRDDQKHRIGVRLTSGGQVIAEDETQLVLLRTSGDDNQPPEPPPVAKWKSIPLWIWITAGSGLLLLVLFGIFIKRRKQKPMPLPVPLQYNSPPPDEPKIIAEQPNNYITNQMSEEIEVMPDNPLPEARLSANHNAYQQAYFEETQVNGSPPRPPNRKTKIRTEFRVPQPGNPSAVLLAEQGPVKGDALPIESEIFWIGADESNSFCIMNDELLSGFHACIQFHEGALFLHDNNSTNGTFLNGERIERIPQPLTPGDSVKVGNSTLKLLVPDNR